MPIQFGELKRNKRRIPVTWDGMTVDIEYSPSSYTAQIEIEMRSITDTPAQSMAGALSEMVTWWDIIEGDTPLPANKETMLHMPVGFLGAMMTAIGEDMRPNQAPAAS